MLWNEPTPSGKDPKGTVQPSVCQCLHPEQHKYGEEFRASCSGSLYLQSSHRETGQWVTSCLLVSGAPAPGPAWPRTCRWHRPGFSTFGELSRPSSALPSSRRLRITGRAHLDLCAPLDASERHFSPTRSLTAPPAPGWHLFRLAISPPSDLSKLQIRSHQRPP